MRQCAVSYFNLIWSVVASCTYREHIQARLALPFKIKLILSFVLQAVMLPVQQEVHLFAPLLPKVEVSLMIELLMEFIGILAKV